MSALTMSGLCVRAPQAVGPSRVPPWRRLLLSACLAVAVARPSGAGAGAAPADISVTRVSLVGPGGEAASAATAVRDGIVVGWFDTAEGRHAFAYDLRTSGPRVRDLGTLGGARSEAAAVDDGIVVGEAERPDGVRHAFAYDLRAPNPRMLDLGALDGTSRAVAVDDRVVVGIAVRSDWSRRAFAYDLRAARPAMRDLGTLGGAESTALGIDGGIIVGKASTPASLWGHVFTYDVRAAHPAMRDLGTLGGSESTPEAMRDGTVVGVSQTGDGGWRSFVLDLHSPAPRLRTLPGVPGMLRAGAGPRVAGSRAIAPRFGGFGRAFVLDRSARRPVVREFGALGGVRSEATAVSASLVAGWWSSDLGIPPRRGFVCDLVSGRAEPVDLGDRSEVAAVDGDVVVGRAAGAATVWIVKRRSA